MRDLARRLLQIIPSPEDLLDLTSDELSWALLEDMQARLDDPTAGMASRDSLSASLLSVGAMHATAKNLRARSESC